MTHRTRGAMVALAVVAVLAGAFSTVRADEPAQDQLLAKIQQLEQKLAALEARQTHAQDVDATVQRVLADAQRRSQLLQAEGFTAGYDQSRGGFIIQSADGNFVLNPSLSWHFRYVANDRDGEGGDDETNNGFEVRRMKLAFAGNAFSPDWTYRFQWEIGDEEDDQGDIVLEDAWVRYAFGGHMAVQFGQFKDIVFREESTGDFMQLAVDRSLLNELLGGGQTDRVQGVMFSCDRGGPLRIMAMLHDGYNSDNTDFTDPPDGSGGGTSLLMSGTHWGVSGRAEYFLRGNRRDYEDFTARGTQDELLVIGAGGDWSQGGDEDIFFHTVDAQWENTKGLGIYGAFVGAWRELTLGGGDDTFYDWGILLQAGYMLNSRWEVFGRYDYISLDDEAPTFATTEDNYHEFTAGVNYYLHGHRAKITVDGTFLPEGAPADARQIGVLASDGEDQFILRAQFQLLL